MSHGNFVFFLKKKVFIRFGTHGAIIILWVFSMNIYIYIFSIFLFSFFYYYYYCHYYYFIFVIFTFFDWQRWATMHMSKLDVFLWLTVKCYSEVSRSSHRRCSIRTPFLQGTSRRLLLSF